MITYKQYEILPEAVQEFKEARLYYKLTRVKGLSNRFAKSVKNTIQQVLKNLARMRSGTMMFVLPTLKDSLMPFTLLLEKNPSISPPLNMKNGIFHDYKKFRDILPYTWLIFLNTVLFSSS